MRRPLNGPAGSRHGRKAFDGSGTTPARALMGAAYCTANGYRWVSSPNYLGESLTRRGFAIAFWSPAALSFVAMTAANLVPRALSNHRW